MASRTLPGLGLQGFWTLGEAWKAGGDTNWLTLSVMPQLVVESATANLPASPANGVVHIVNAAGGGNAAKVAVRDAGAWVYITAPLGTTAWVKDATGADKRYRFDGTTWVREAQNVDWAVYGGTANVITLTPTFSRDAYAVGDTFRFRATATNTGATTINVNGLGAKTAVTIRGTALPSGYIRTNADTVITYDGTNFVVSREVERGSNANGDFVRHADGTLLCSITRVFGTNPTIAAGGYHNDPVWNWTYPAAFLSKPQTFAQLTGNFASQLTLGFATLSVTAANDMYVGNNSGISTTPTGPFYYKAEGVWY